MPENISCFLHFFALKGNTECNSTIWLEDRPILSFWSAEFYLSRNHLDEITSNLLDLTRKCVGADWTEQKKFFQPLPNLSLKTCKMSSKWCYWNDRRSCRVFLCFYSAIFQLTSAKFQTFAYNLRTVGSSNMKFWQQFEINELYVCTKFRGNRSRDFSFRTRKPPCKFGLKSGFSQKQL